MNETERKGRGLKTTERESAEEDRKMHETEGPENLHLFRTADELKAAKAWKKSLDAEAKELNKTISGLEMTLISDMNEAGLHFFNRHGTTFYLITQNYASAKEGKKQDLLRELRARGLGDMITESVNVQTLGSFCKEQRALSGGEKKLPEWLDICVDAYEKVTVGVRKSTPTGGEKP